MPDRRAMSPAASGSRLAVIPARGGSKRVPGKNVRMLLGKPAIVYTIDAAAESGLFDRIVVSTDSEEIAEIAVRHGAQVPFLRDAHLADDHTPVSLATVDALERIDAADEVEEVAQLMANCPLRTAADICESHRQFVWTGAPAQLSVTRFGWQNPWWAMERMSGYELRPLFSDQVTARSQELPPLFCPTGAIWWARARVLRRARSYHVPHRTGWEMPWQRAIDIDTEDDWRIAVRLLEAAPPAVGCGDV
ncbi:MAG TPA: acylneuraminate cytidylyltransferase family protein [Gemmatimonadaceae bacterium]|nr:acylneuraminate cytidylyltransferase family protein [Gemmatimonadaceae bacterium]